MVSLTIGQLNMMGFHEGKKALEYLGYRLTSYNEDKKGSNVMIHATFRSSEGVVHFSHEYKEKRKSEKQRKMLRWELGKI